MALANVSDMGMDTGASSTWPTDSSSVIHHDGLLIKCAVREYWRGPENYCELAYDNRLNFRAYIYDLKREKCPQDLYKFWTFAKPQNFVHVYSPIKDHRYGKKNVVISILVMPFYFN